MDPSAVLLACTSPFSSVTIPPPPLSYSPVPAPASSLPSSPTPAKLCPTAPLLLLPLLLRGGQLLLLLPLLLALLLLSCSSRSSYIAPCSSCSYFCFSCSYFCFSCSSCSCSFPPVLPSCQPHRPGVATATTAQCTSHCLCLQVPSINIIYQKCVTVVSGRKAIVGLRAAPVTIGIHISTEILKTSDHRQLKC